jgi:hypothetical protein
MGDSVAQVCHFPQALRCIVFQISLLRKSLDRLDGRQSPGSLALVIRSHRSGQGFQDRPPDNEGSIIMLGLRQRLNFPDFGVNLLCGRLGDV